jgi:hypothetical protein
MITPKQKQAMKTPGHEEYESSEDWYGGEFESE